MFNAIRRFLRRGRPGARLPPLRIEPLVSEAGFRLSGELDLYTVEALRTALGPELHGTVVLDFAAVDFIDDSGLGLIAATIKRLRQQGGTLVVRNPPSHLRRVLEVTGLEKVPGLTIEPCGATGEGD